MTERNILIAILMILHFSTQIVSIVSENYQNLPKLVVSLYAKKNKIDGIKVIEVCENGAEPPFCCLNGEQNADCCEEGFGQFCCSNGANNPQCEEIHLK
jgi:hypothetical protein